MFTNIQENFSHGCYDQSNIGESFVYSFATATVLSGGNVVTGMFIGGSCALATTISTVVRPVFLGLLNYKHDDKPHCLARFAENIIVLTTHALILGNYNAALINWVGTAIISALMVFRERDTKVSDPQLFCNLNTLAVLLSWDFVKWGQKKLQSSS